MKAEDILFRSSGVGNLFSKTETDNMKFKPELSDTAITHCIDIFVSKQWGRREQKTNKFLKKGNGREEDSITLFSRVKKKFYKKNDLRLNNAFITGECDLFDGPKITEAKETVDTKTSWSAFTYYRSFGNPDKLVDKDYFWQGQSYMALTGAQKHTVAFCLVNGLSNAILTENKYASYESTCIDYETDPAYIEKCKQIEINHIFDIEHFYEENPGFDFANDIDEWLANKTWDIPMKNRVFTFEIERSEEAIKALYSRIYDARKWMEENLFNKL